MRYAVLSDIHSNLEALEAVLTDAGAQSCDQYVCLGDVVGYNANPSECVKRIQDLGCPVVKGNHDEQASVAVSTESFNEMAEEAIGWTREHLSADNKAWLSDLRLTRQVRDFTIVHASLDTPERWDYVFDDLDAIASFTCQHTPLCFFGHTHWPTAFVRAMMTPSAVSRRAICLTPGENISSIPAASASRAIATGAPPIASSTPTPGRRATACEYDLETAQSKIRQAGLPERPRRPTVGRPVGQGALRDCHPERSASGVERAREFPLTFSPPNPSSAPG
jgi:predicted phosphodiesterase